MTPGQIQDAARAVQTLVDAETGDVTITKAESAALVRALEALVALAEAAEAARDEAVRRGDLLASAVEMGLDSDHATIRRMCHYYRTGVDLPCGQFRWPTSAHTSATPAQEGGE